MKGYRIILVLVLTLCAGMSHAAITAGWRMPVEGVIQGAKVDEALPKLEKPPGESAFFEEGDVLRDLSKLVSERAGDVQLADGERAAADPFGEARAVAPIRRGGTPSPLWTGDWVVWNERSGMVVARGSYNDVFVVEAALGFLGLPKTIRTKIEVVCGDPARSRSLLASVDSGMRGESEGEGLEVETESISCETGEWFDERLYVRWAAGGEDLFWQVTAALTLTNGKRTLLARQGSGASGWELFATATALLPGEVPVNEARWVERDGRTEAWPRSAGNDGRFVSRLGDGQESCLYLVPFPEGIWTGEGGVPLSPFPRVSCPETIRDRMRGEVADLRGKLQVRNLGELSFAGYDSRSGRVMLVGDAEGIDSAEAWLQGGLVDQTTGMWVESNDEAGGWGLVCRAGEKASIRLDRGEETHASFKIEVNTMDEAMDLRFAMDVMPGSKVTGRIESATVLMPGSPQVVGGYEAAGGDGEVKFTLMVRRVAVS